MPVLDIPHVGRTLSLRRFGRLGDWSARCLPARTWAGRCLCAALDDLVIGVLDARAGPPAPRELAVAVLVWPGNGL